VAESKDGLDDREGDRYGEAVAVSRRDDTSTALDDLTNAVHLLLHEPIRVTEGFEHGVFVDEIEQLRSVLELAICEFATGVWNAPLPFGVPFGLLLGHKFVEYLPGFGESDRDGGLVSSLQGRTSTAILEADGVEVIAIRNNLRVVDLIGASFAEVKRDGGGRYGSG
jgi:hypothetical protein